ncbi:RNA polymerase I-specific transcription initiation factor RRN3 homolog Tif-IA isoform X2 [Oratosquilla oratoria]
MPLRPILKKTAPSPNGRETKRVFFDTKITPRTVILHYKDNHDPAEYQRIFFHLSSHETELKRWIVIMTENVAILDQRVDQLVLDFLKIPWFGLKDDIANEMKNFVLTLVMAHNYYTHPILDITFKLLVPVLKPGSEEKLRNNPHILAADDKLIFSRAINLIVAIHNHVPMCRENILSLAKNNRPFFKRHVYLHTVFCKNLLQLATLLPHLQRGILEIIISNMVTIDVHAPRAELSLEEDSDEEDKESDNEDDLFHMEVEETSSGIKQDKTAGVMSHMEGHTLDMLMATMLWYIHSVCHGTLTFTSQELKNESDKCPFNGKAMEGTEKKLTLGCQCQGKHHNLEALKNLYTDLQDIFIRIILPTHASSHVQFLIFYLLAIRPGLASIFLEFLRVNKFENPNSGREIRKNAMSYMGSLLARGKFIPFSHVHSCLEVICSWCSAYLENQERIQTRNYEDLMVHSPFYYACQTILYVFTFRYREYTENEKKLSFARVLNLERLVLSKLNPLRICAPAIVSNFAAVTRRFQLAYCSTILENNKRMTLPSVSSSGGCSEQGRRTHLDMFFPFDPYLLQRSKNYITQHYREFDGLPDDVKVPDLSMEIDEDDFLEASSSPRSLDFTYGTSPGYKRW